MTPFLAIEFDLSTAKDIFNYFGFPLIFLGGMAYVARELFLWAKPHVEKCIAAYADRQDRAAASLEKSVDQTIALQTQGMEIHKSNAEVLREIKNSIPNICRTKP